MERAGPWLTRSKCIRPPNLAAVTIQRGHTLATTGTSGTTRHPNCRDLLIIALGWVLAVRSGVGVLLLVLILVPLFSRITAEERLLQAQFGAEYEIYRAPK